MASINKVILIGRLTKDPTEHNTQNGHKAVRFTLAVDRNFKDANGNKQADFISVVAWDKLADLISKYCKKGKEIAIVGRLQTGSYTGQDGQKRYTTDVVAEEVQLLADPKNSSNSKNSNNNDDDFNFDGFEEINTEGLPF
ncbi:single-stranded DNA-binding protein [Thermoanaerobacterium thermosaccharolyticum]|uniref:single-stranded DNA-binding protein n=1 Tax=Thermoanaerobacterium thermosaccharolyticum TaxID=1517 RepID=UPI00177D2CB7|nr:single-stranded DNA-binding protein [Thermoanaerobacterium thermosaccharolyticum]MBE0069887.1 single-stranded DNA-binding protein [Thermoanaerobacterium thermosaccharolyticum]MBE0228015.1 single-stranded DNA-binding protein [Thermoanaerobacterium thermosaccharolyticum]